MPACKEINKDMAYMELQVIQAKAIKCLEQAAKHLRRCNPFLKALELDGAIGDLDGFIDAEHCVGSSS